MLNRSNKPVPQCNVLNCDYKFNYIISLTGIVPSTDPLLKSYLFNDSKDLIKEIKNYSEYKYSVEYLKGTSMTSSYRDISVKVNPQSIWIHCNE